jgi:hypothetical protein
MKYRILALLLFFSILGLVVVYFTARWGIGTSPDSVIYIGGARNLAMGQGFSMPYGVPPHEPITFHAPFYSVLLSLFGLIGVDPMAGARWLNGLLFGATILLVGLLLQSFAKGDDSTAGWIALIGAFLALTSATLLEIHVMAWSETAFLFFSLVGFILLAGYLENSNRWLLCGAAILVGLAFLSRYIGITLLATGFLGLLIFGRKVMRKRLVDAVLFAGVGVLPMALWLVRNLGQAGTATSRVVSFHPIMRDHLAQGLATISSWLLVPDTASGVIQLIPLAAIAIGFLAVVFIQGRKGGPTSAAGAIIRLPVAGFLKLAALFIPVYLAFLALSISFMDANTQLNGRILSPVFLFGLILTLYGVYTWVNISAGNRWLRYGLLSVGLLIAVFYSLQASKLVMAGYRDGLGFNSLAWAQSETLARLNDLPEEVVVYTNAPEAIYLHTSHPAFSLPRKNDLAAQRLNPEYEAEMAQTMRALNEEAAVLVYFTRLPRSSASEEQGLAQALQLCVLDQMQDGNLYVSSLGQIPCQTQP